MDKILFYFFTILLSLIVGAILGFVTYTFLDYLKKLRLKKKVPNDKKDMLDGGDVTINKKEVEDNEERKFGKFREFEKLRRLSENKGVGEYGRSVSRIAELKGGELLSPTNYNQVRKSNEGAGKHKRRIKFD